MSVCAQAKSRRKAARVARIGKTGGSKIRGRIERAYVDTGPAKKAAKMANRKKG